MRRLLCCLISFGLFATSCGMDASGQTWSARKWTVSASSSITDYGDNSVRGSLAWIIANSSGTRKIVVPTEVGVAQITTSISIPAGVFIEVEPGAQLGDSDDTATLTWAAGSGLIAGIYQIFGPLIQHSSFPLVAEVYPEWFGAVADGSTDNEAIINEIVAAVVPGQVIRFTDVTNDYNIDDEINIAKSLTIKCNNGVTIAQQTSNTGGFVITASDVTIDGCTIVGPQYASYQVYEMGVYAYGSSSSNYLSGIRLNHNNINTWGGHAIRLWFVEDFEVLSDTISNIYYHGIHMLSCLNGIVDDYNIDNITRNDGTIPAGITATRVESNSISTDPLSEYIVIGKGSVSAMVGGQGIDTHGGQHINMGPTNIYGVKWPIDVVPSKNASAVETWAPKDVNILVGVIDSGVTDGSKYSGISFAGISSGDGATGSIVGGVIRGHGVQSTATHGCLYLRDTEGLNIVGGLYDECSPNAISAYVNNKDLSIVGVTIQDPWSTSGTGRGMTIGQNSSITIDGVTFSKDEKSATSVLAQALNVTGTNNVDLRIGSVRSEAATFLSDSSDNAKRGGYSSAGTSGTGEDTLKSTLFPAGSLGVGERIHVVAGGVKNANNDVKTLKFYVGTDSITFISGSNSADDWRFDAWMTITATSTQDITWAAWNGTTITQGRDTASQSTTSDITLKITGECANASDSITQTAWVLERQ